jgi:aspartate/glutamate racemase
MIDEVGYARADSALHALAIDDGGGRAGFSFALLPTRHMKRVMDAIQRAVVAPQVEIVEKCAARRQIFRDRRPKFVTTSPTLVSVG